MRESTIMRGHVTALGGGHDIEVAGAKGRIRAYANSPVRSGTYTFSVAFNSGSDALVATVVVTDGRQPASIEPVIIQFLSGKTIQRWVKLTLGL